MILLFPVHLHMQWVCSSMNFKFPYRKDWHTCTSHLHGVNMLEVLPVVQTELRSSRVHFLSLLRHLDWGGRDSVRPQFPPSSEKSVPTRHQSTVTLSAKRSYIPNNVSQTVYKFCTDEHFVVPAISRISDGRHYSSMTHDYSHLITADPWTPYCLSLLGAGDVTGCEHLLVKVPRRALCN